MQKTHFISCNLAGKDLFEGKSHERLSRKIIELLQSKSDDPTIKDGKVIGIEGGWGSGKSNLVEMIKTGLHKDNYKFFIYDAWGYQCDLQRRTILEELVNELVTGGENSVLGDQWIEKRDALLAKKIDTEHTSIPKLSPGLILLAILPFWSIFADTLDVCWWADLLILCVPLYILIGLLIRYLIKNRQKLKGHFKENIVDFLKDFTYVFTEKVEESKSTEYISEKEPSSKLFRDWLESMDNEIDGKWKLVLVFDNLDRLPKEKVKELWATIHTFFAEHRYNNINVLIPFDRRYVASVYDDMGEDGDYKHNGDDYINKTFDVVFSVAPQIMTGWKSYFNIKYKEAFGESAEADDDLMIVFDKLCTTKTPRKIISFINDIVSIRICREDMEEEEIADKYIALYIFGRKLITANPIEEIMNPSYLNELEYRYREDKNMPSIISALHFQLPIKKAEEVVLTNQIRVYLDEGNKGILGIMEKITGFTIMLNEAVTGVDNLPNAVKAVDYLDEVPQTTWDYLYKKDKIQETQLKEYHKILLKHISNKDSLLELLINNFVQGDKVDYVKSLYDIVNLKIENLLVFPKITPVDVSARDYIECLELTKGDYKKYRFRCPEEELDSYLSQCLPEVLANYGSLKYYEGLNKLENYHNTLIGYVENTSALSSTEDKIKLSILQRLKEIEHPLHTYFQNADMYNMLGHATSDNLRAEILCMYIAKMDTFPDQYEGIFIKQLKEEDEAQAETLSKIILDYVDYAGLSSKIIEYDLWQLSRIFVKVSNREQVEISEEAFVKMLKNYELIKSHLHLEDPETLDIYNQIYAINHIEIQRDYISDIPLAFYEDLRDYKESDLKQHVKESLKEYLSTLTQEEWHQHLEAQDKDYVLRKKFEHLIEIDITIRN